MLASLLLLVGASVIAAETGAPVTGLAFSPDGKTLVSVSQNGVATYSWPDLKSLERTKPPFSHLHDLAFSPGGTRLAIAGGEPQETGGVEIVEWPGRKSLQTIEAGKDVVYSTAWTSDGKSLVMACADKTVRLHNFERGTTQEITDHSAAVLAVLFAPLTQESKTTEFLLSASRDQSIRVFDAVTARPLRTLDNHTAAVNDLALCPAQKDELPLVASAGQDKTVRFWQPSIGRLVRFARLPSPLLTVRWLPNGDYVAVTGTDGHLRILDWQTLRIAFDRKIDDGWLTSLAVSPTSPHVVLGDERGELHVVSLDGIKRE